MLIVLSNKESTCAPEDDDDDAKLAFPALRTLEEEDEGDSPLVEAKPG